jgi:hypothetical protein
MIRVIAGVAVLAFTGPVTEAPSYLTDVQREEAGFPTRAEEAVLAGEEDQPQDPGEVVEEPVTRGEVKLPRHVRLQNAVQADGAMAASIIPRIIEWGPHLTDAQAYDIAMNIARQCRQRNLKPEVVVALIKVESGYNIHASSPTNDHGLMQLHGKRIYDIKGNINEGCDELMWRLENKGGDYRAALAGYNGGTYPPPVSWGYADKVLGLADQVY